MTIIEKIMRTENCSKADAEKFYQLAKELESPDFTKEKGVEIYKTLEELRRK